MPTSATGQPAFFAQMLETIHQIVADIEHSFHPDTFWETHPRDRQGEPPTPPSKTVYLGAAGMLWALERLRRSGMTASSLPSAELGSRIWDAYLQAPDTDEIVPSLFLGATGILLLNWGLKPTPELEAELFRHVSANTHHPALEPLWGSPGTMLAALHLYSATRSESWRWLSWENVEALLESLHEHASPPCCLWTQDMYGHQVMHLGAGHGFAGNMFAILAAQALLTPEQRAKIYALIEQTLDATAITTDGYANWPQSIGTPRPGRTAMLVQWCHGAPGIITSLAPFPKEVSPRVEQLLHSAGELTWLAGPLRKGHGLCHGTAGNGYAMLTLFQRTQDELWLSRARAFAMHAISQYHTIRAEYGRGWYSLWTGDAGLALFLADCINGSGFLPLYEPCHILA